MSRLSSGWKHTPFISFPVLIIESWISEEFHKYGRFREQLHSILHSGHGIYSQISELKTNEMTQFGI